MRQLKTFLTASFILLFSLAGKAQTTDTTKTKPQFKLSVNYNNNLNFYGRTDSLKSSGFFPMAELWFSPEFYVNAAPIFVNNALQKFDYAGTVATVGYQHVGTKWISGVYLLKPFYKESSELVQSALKAQGGVNLSYQNKILNLNAGGAVLLSDKLDYNASGGVDHIVRKQFKDNSVLVFDPGFYAYAGTQNFQRTYYKRNNSGFLLFPGNNQQVTEDVSRFVVLAYEATMPIIYAKNKWMFIATPSYIMPQNLITVAGRPDLSERGEKTFYTTLTAKYTF